MKKYSLYLIPLYILYLGIYYYVALPPFNWHAPEFWRFLIFGFGPLLIILLLSSLTIRGIQGARDFGSMFHRNVVMLVRIIKNGKQLQGYALWQSQLSFFFHVLCME